MNDAQDPARPGLAGASLANSFRFTYRGKAITFVQANIAGQPVLSVGDQQFVGDEITLEQSQLGELVTVVLSATADGDATHLTLVLPPTRVEGFQELDIKALAVRTTVRAPSPARRSARACSTRPRRSRAAPRSSSRERGAGRGAPPRGRTTRRWGPQLSFFACMPATPVRQSSPSARAASNVWRMRGA